ncbi:MAG TPA: FUN14 domain-containing protein [Candidatus Binatia bacterium]|nr:FUN14 domain-containing protein [Candidatus Binatia bacterium]
MESSIWDLIEETFKFITSGSIGGLPPIIVMIIPLVIGLIVGYLINKFLKIAIIATIAVAVAAYLGFFTLNVDAMKDLADKYGPTTVQYGTLIVAILPLGIGFVIGLVVGFLLSK